MTPSDIIQEDPGSRQSIGPGERLKAERIEQGLSIEDVAMRMHLSVGILESIEENNFDDITAPIFVKGYLRAYARIVSLDEDEMIQQYLNYYSDEDPPISSTSNLAPEISSDDARIKWATSLVVTGLLALLAVWWWNQYQIKTDVFSLDAGLSDSVQQPGVTSDIADSKVETAAETTLIETPDIQPPPLPVEKPVATDLTVVANIQQAVNLELAEQNIIEVVPQETEVMDLEVSSEEVSRTAPTGSEQLKIIIHADTWVDVEDANGHRLVYELLRAEQKLNLIGQAPFAVFLGNGHGVELIFNNETIDISSRIRDNNTARLKIGSS